MFYNSNYRPSVLDFLKGDTFQRVAAFKLPTVVSLMYKRVSWLTWWLWLKRRQTTTVIYIHTQVFFNQKQNQFETSFTDRWRLREDLFFEKSPPMKKKLLFFFSSIVFPPSRIFQENSFHSNERLTSWRFCRIRRRRKKQ